MAAGDVYATVQGFVAFEPEEREIPSGAIVRNVVVDSLETGELIRLTLWPEYRNLDVEKSDYVVAAGKYTERTVDNDEGGKKTYKNISVNKIVAFPSFAPEPVEVTEPTPRRRRSS